MEDKFNQAILGKLKDQHITPKPRWVFDLKNYTIWGASALSLAVGGLAFSVLIYLMINNDWGMRKELDNNFLDFILLTLPYFWFIILALFILLVYYDIKHTKKGYRYSILLIFVGSVSASIILGGVFFAVGMGQYIDDVLGQKAPFYRGMVNPQMNFWDHPEQGRMIGVFISQLRSGEFIIRDMRKKEWQTRFEANTILPPGGIIIGEPFRMIGEIRADGIFVIRRITPVGPGRCLFKPCHTFLYVPSGQTMISVSRDKVIFRWQVI